MVAGIPSVELVCSGSTEHTSQLFTGFGLLHGAGLASVRLRRAPDFRAGASGLPYLRAVVDGRHRLFFDLSDGDGISPADLAWSTHYLKRSYDPACHGDDDRLHPLGLNYPVYGPGDWRTRRLWWALGSLRPSTVRQVATSAVRLNRALSWLLRANGGCRSSEVRAFEGPPSVSAHPTAVCLTRVWDPARVSGEKADEWRQLNTTRTECIRLLRRELGPTFVGGIEPSPYAVANHADLVVDAASLRKATYLRTMHRADVCVTSGGLRQSIGWRMGEYVAASRAVVSERLRYVVPGSFAEGTNYLGFESPDECVAATVALLADADRRLEMMRANQAYYQAWVRPDRLVANALAVVDDGG